MRPNPSFFLTFLLVAACSGTEDSNDPAGLPDAGDTSDAISTQDVQTEADAGPSCGEIGATRCMGTLVETCEATGWSAPIECPGEQGCRGDLCQDPTEKQQNQAQSVVQFIDELDYRTGWHQSVDKDAVKKRESLAILKGDGSNTTYFGAAWRALNAYPQGHQSLYASDAAACGKAMAYQMTSRFGVCARPVHDGFVVTFASDLNILGLRAGDVITRADGVTGDALFESSYFQPVCGSVFPSASGRRHAAAASFFGTVPAGTSLEVRSPEGEIREVVVPVNDDSFLTSCYDPFARDPYLRTETVVRSDGVAVIRLPNFFPFDKSLPTDPQEIEAFIQAYQDEIVEAFEAVKSAKAMVWDTRGNLGGFTNVGLAIVGGFPSARPTSISYCSNRTPGSSPPSFSIQYYALYEVTPGGPFEYEGKVAVVTDGLAYSAGDYFPLAVLRASDAPVVGTATAGAFGGVSYPIELAGPPGLEAQYDMAACVDQSNKAFLEGAPPSPTFEVEYDPADLAMGRDTLLEHAIQLLDL